MAHRQIRHDLRNCSTCSQTNLSFQDRRQGEDHETKIIVHGVCHAGHGGIWNRRQRSPGSMRIRRRVRRGLRRKLYWQRISKLRLFAVPDIGHYDRFWIVQSRHRLFELPRQPIPPQSRPRPLRLASDIAGSPRQSLPHSAGALGLSSRSPPRTSLGPGDPDDGFTPLTITQLNVRPMIPGSWGVTAYWPSDCRNNLPVHRPIAIIDPSIIQIASAILMVMKSSTPMHFIRPTSLPATCVSTWTF